MKLEQATIQRTFTILYRGKTYHVDYLNSTGQILSLMNRENWEIYSENNELLNIYLFKNTSKKERFRIKKNIDLAKKLVKFCITHFEDYNPVDKEEEIKKVDIF